MEPGQSQDAGAAHMEYKPSVTWEKVGAGEQKPLRWNMDSARA